MNTRLIYAAMAAMTLVAPSVPTRASEIHPWWHYFIIAKTFERGSWLTLGTDTDATPGYDGLPAEVIGTGEPRVWMLLYRENSPEWTGPTGFFSGDIEPPLKPFEVKTWGDIYFWAENYAPPPEGIEVIFVPDPGPPARDVRLFIDQVPESVNWTGPREFEFSKPSHLLRVFLPIAQVSNPLDGTRMHITVTAVPEPSGLLALAAASAGLLALARRRRG